MTPITVTYYSDVLCIWAYVAQARVDAIRRTFPDEVRLDYRFVSVFGDTRLKLGEGWSDRDGFAGYARHVAGIAARFEHVQLDPRVWSEVQRELARPFGIDLAVIERLIDDGSAFARLSTDYQSAEKARIEGSPTFVLNEGRQKLFGNVGFRVIEANIREVLRDPNQDQASWC